MQENSVSYQNNSSIKQSWMITASPKKNFILFDETGKSSKHEIVPKNLNFMLLRYFFSFPLSEYKMRCNKNPKRRRRQYFATFFDLFYITEIFFVYRMGRSDLTQICILLDQVNYRLGSAWWKFLLCTHLEIRLSFMTSLNLKEMR